MIAVPAETVPISQLEIFRSGLDGSQMQLRFGYLRVHVTWAGTLLSAAVASNLLTSRRWELVQKRALEQLKSG